ncbi:hypothetical protein TNCT_469201 [Trichonephila clavata]|uniref:Uncharacterized protein n=1 Tax=Trichonephila clavata TaxID=2740835 RepID=A0A8X6JFY3_TRICU|nr:hypothetical protein TNCT_469201 [Trichonephila clavata]
MHKGKIIEITAFFHVRNIMKSVSNDAASAGSNNCYSTPIEIGSGCFVWESKWPPTLTTFFSCNNGGGVMTGQSFSRNSTPDVFYSQSLEELIG